MTLAVGQSLLIIFVCAVCTQLERALPFLVFKGREVPKVIRYLGEILPMAVMATLVIYCLRGVTFTAAENFAPQLIAVAVTVALHLWGRNTLLSIFGGTACYMLLVQLVF
ncbi:MAG: branched-chain amino acid transporter AzlD [Clostridia bacterium]|nr:branched-chain amino acid transporter AzlD [Clostridia bacterium]